MILLSMWIDIYMHVTGICVPTNWAVLVLWSWCDGEPNIVHR